MSCLRRPAATTFVVLVLAVGLSTAAACGSEEGSSSSTTRRSTTSTDAPGTSAPSTSSTIEPVTATIPPLLPLYPFLTTDDVGGWQEARRQERGDARFADPEQTALAFAAEFLGYRDVDRVIDRRSDAQGEHVTVGFRNEAGPAAAAVVHLVPFGTGEPVAWEVVGTDDTELTLTTPAYGGTVTSPLNVGGTITGIDESIRVQVRQLRAEATLGQSTPTPAGGNGSPWQTTVTFAPPTDPVLVVSAATGGHVRDVERFAVTGVRVAP